MIALGVGIVQEIIEQNKEIQIVQVLDDMNKTISKAIYYLKYFPALNIGDKVLMNKTATKLGLGTGGYDFIVIPHSMFDQQQNLSLVHDEQGHIMKLRYTPYQFSIQSCEEQESPFHELLKEKKEIEKMPVIIGELHSMLPILITVFRQLEKKYQQTPKKIVYIMTDGAALPIAFSKNVSKLKELGWLDYTITIGHAYGGDLEAVNIYSGLLAAKHILQADFVIVLMGPGIVGTGTTFGHTGVEQGELINAVSIMDGVPVSIIRASSGDQRGRHSGISHHTMLNLTKISLRKSIIPYPKFICQTNEEIFNVLNNLSNNMHTLAEVDFEHQELINFLQAYPISITTMGRTLNDDALFFAFVASASYWMFNYLTK